ncbi:LysE family translocator [Paenibacillus sambharensis]|uniref:LysE family translocator n=1 Tax=Paenibacillus sambharensis TaxID=1803190 RepID=A0A2W1LMM0_9BACL|nr:LysE family translocator [Paenibacillus sambharensis]PZD93041.1 LysE family translocator [Paenibacillus sambharensis]
MTFELWISFVIASLLIIATPGPVVTLLVTTSISRGKNAAFSMIPGTFLGDLTSMLLSLAGVGALLLASPSLFNILKWLGAAYLVYLGIRLWIEAAANTRAKDKPAVEKSKSALKAFWVTILNPKSFLFYVAFMPQFVSKDEAFLPQILLLGATFLALGIMNDITYTVLADKVVRFLNNQAQKWVHRIGALNLMATGVIIIMLKS